MKVVPYSQLDPAAWNACCDVSDQAWLFHRAEWVAIERDLFVLECHAFAVMSEDRVVAVQPLYLAESGLGAWTERVVHSGYHRHAGLAVVGDLQPQELKAVRNLAMQKVAEVARLAEAHRIQLNVQNLAPESFTVSRQEIPFWMDGYGFQLGLHFSALAALPIPGMSTLCADQIVDLQRSPETLFATLDESCRRAVRKAQAAGLDLEVIEACDGPAVEAYYDLAVRSAARTGESLAPKAYFERIVDAFAAERRCAILFVTSQGKRVASVLLGIDKTAASYLGGISDPEYLPLRVNDFAHWSVLRWGAEAGLRRYRLGPTFPELPMDWQISKVSRFKAKFGGRGYTVIQGSRFLAPERYVSAAPAAVEALLAVTTEPTP